MKAISLFSGGLDSQLAVCLLLDQNIEVLAINFSTPFFGATARTRQAARDLGIELRVVDISDEYFPGVLKNPVYGFGKNSNPCIDCHGFMLKKAGDLMEETGASFLATGEVVGQRPMSQNKSAINAVNKLSGYRDFIVRPLSAQLLPPTEPELRKWIDRERLLDIQGRSRSRQMELAEKYGIKDYPSPAGGCLLTDAGYCRRLNQMLGYHPDPRAEELEILKLGRHFYLQDDCLLAVGRNHAENTRLEEIALPGDLFFKVADRPGPLGLLRPAATGVSSVLELAAAIVARYSDARNMQQATVKIFSPHHDQEQTMVVAPLSPDKVPDHI